MTTDQSPDLDFAPLQHLEIPIPCTESWEAMAGDEQVRHCGLCRKNVYNLSAMPQAQAAAFVAAHADEGVCVRFYRRSDGTVLTSDCSTSGRVKLQRAMRTVPRAVAGAAGAAGAAAAVAVAVAHAMPGKPLRSVQEPYVVEISLVDDLYINHVPVVGLLVIPERARVRPAARPSKPHTADIELEAAVEPQAADPVPATPVEPQVADPVPAQGGENAIGVE